MKHFRVYAESQIAQKRTAQSYHQGKTSDKKIEKTRGNAMDLGNLDRRQDRKKLTRGKSTLAMAPRSLTHHACTPLDIKVKEKEDGPSTATATAVASLGMRGGTAHAWMKLAKPRWLNVRASFSRAVKRRTMG